MDPVVMACVLPVVVSFLVVGQPVKSHADHGEKKKKASARHRSRHHNEKEIPLPKPGVEEQDVK